MVPVAVGTGVAAAQGDVVWWRAACALLVSLSLQIATNYANDYSDGIRGTDDVRVGPVRLVASGLAEPLAVRRAAFAAFVLAALFGLPLVVAVGPELLIVGVASIAAGWFYTGGSKPYGYAGFGEVFVFLFFGVVATMGTAYVQLESVTGLAFGAAVPMGLLATALLVVNNLRDREGDAVSGKRTLSVRLGDGRTRRLYAMCVLGPYLFVAWIALERPRVLLAMLTIPWAVKPLQRVLRGATGPALIPVLGGTAALQLWFGLAFTAGLGWS